MKNCIAGFLLFIGGGISLLGGAASSDRTVWWREAGFGMFIHWGLYSLEGRGEWILYQEHIPFEEYRTLADRFHPRDFRPEEWSDLK